MDTVFIKNLSMYGVHGVSVEERAKEQEFLMDITVELDTRTACATDRLEDTVDWWRLLEIARESVERKTYYLIEKLADVIAKKILEDKKVSKVSITIHKKEPLPTGLPGISIERTR